MTDRRKLYKTIDLKHRDRSVRLYTRLIWQVLFDAYRDTGGPLDHMDNMLCDLYSLERFFNLNSEGWQMRWYCCGFSTEWESPNMPCLNENSILVVYDGESHTVAFFREPLADWIGDA